MCVYLIFLLFTFSFEKITFFISNLSKVSFALKLAQCFLIPSSSDSK